LAGQNLELGWGKRAICDAANARYLHVQQARRRREGETASGWTDVTISMAPHGPGKMVIAAFAYNQRVQQVCITPVHVYTGHAPACQTGDFADTVSFVALPSFVAAISAAALLLASIWR
jgi:hypothetical protein